MTDIPEHIPGVSEMTVYVRVRLSDVERTIEWREVKADSLDGGIKTVEQMPDVEVCLEASWIAGGALT
jgi:hypothetical protein